MSLLFWPSFPVPYQSYFLRKLTFAVQLYSHTEQRIKQKHLQYWCINYTMNICINFLEEIFYLIKGTLNLMNKFFFFFFLDPMRLPRRDILEVWFFPIVSYVTKGSKRPRTPLDPCTWFHLLPNCDLPASRSKINTKKTSKNS